MAAISTGIVLIILAAVGVRAINEMEITAEDGRMTVKNCNITEVPFLMYNLTTKPEFFQFGTFLWVNVTILMLENVIAPIEVEVSIQMKIDGLWEELCDLFQDRCHMPDLCVWLKKNVANRCPSLIQKKGSNCLCPFHAETYPFWFPFQIPKTTFDLYGSFDFKVKLKQQGRALGCFNFRFCLGYCT